MCDTMSPVLSVQEGKNQNCSAQFGTTLLMSKWVHQTMSVLHWSDLHLSWLMKAFNLRQGHRQIIFRWKEPFLWPDSWNYWWLKWIKCKSFCHGCTPRNSVILNVTELHKKSHLLGKIGCEVKLVWMTAVWLSNDAIWGKWIYLHPCLHLHTC